MENTAKNFALQLGSLVSLYVSIVAIIILLFGIITVRYPDVAQGYWEYESASSSIRWGIALLLVFFPTYVVLTRLVNTIRRTEHGTYLALTKWLIYLSLLIGGATILGDLVAVVNGFLNGELTIRFALKALAFLAVVGSAFVYYLFDARGYWQTHEKQSIQYGAAVAVLVVATLVAGFMHTETPTEVREMRLDTVQIQDLSLMQSQIESYFLVNSVLPQSVELAYGGIKAATAPEGRSAYTYTIIDEKSYELCAEFAYESTKSEQAQYTEPVKINGSIANENYNWTHGKGDWCFTRFVITAPLAPQEKG